MVRLIRDDLTETRHAFVISKMLQTQGTYCVLEYIKEQDIDLSDATTILTQALMVDMTKLKLDKRLEIR